MEEHTSLTTAAENLEAAVELFRRDMRDNNKAMWFWLAVAAVRTLMEIASAVGIIADR
jgi:hypothetical protein